MTEYGPPIPVNGKRPVSLAKSLEYADYISTEGRPGIIACDADESYWGEIATITLRRDHPYYQSAEYKAHKASDELYHVMQERSGKASVGELSDELPQTLLARYAATLEAAGYTVTPHDPLAADRELLAGLCDVLQRDVAARGIREGHSDRLVPAAMEYLTRWADARGKGA